MDQYAAPVVWSPTTRDHDPRHEVWVGVATDGTEVAARVDAILETLRAGGHPVVEANAHPDDVLAQGARPGAARLPRHGGRPLARGSVRRPGRPGPRGALPLPDPGDDRRPARPPGRGRARRRRPVRLRHDDARRPGHLGGRPSGGRLRPDGGRPGRRGRAAGLRAVPAARAPRDAGRLRRLLLPEQRGRRGRGPARPRASSGSRVIDVDAHQGNGTAAIFYDRGDVLYGSVHVDPAAGWFPHVVGYADEIGTGAGEGATRNLPLPEGTGDDALARGGAASSPSGPRREAARLWWSRWASTPRRTTRRARCWSPADGYRAAGALLGATGLPAVVVQEGGYHLPTLGGLVAAYLEGHARAAD